LKIGIVSDLHCNHAGLVHALEILGDVDELVCLGDSIYEYRFSNEVVRLLRERGAHTILGNHEEGFLGPHGARARQPDWIDRAHLQWLAERPKRLELEVGGKKLLLVHSTPWEPQGAYVYPHDSLLTRFGEAEADFVLYGHTHHQLVRRVGKVLVINPGSAGEARDQGNGRQLSCAVLDTASEGPGQARARRLGPGRPTQFGGLRVRKSLNPSRGWPAASQVARACSSLS
jgi:putative phosphoesterase